MSDKALGYFAGLGSGKGWHSFHFILTPEELSEVFKGLDYFFVITGSRVDSDYKETPRQEYFDAYSVFFEEILIGEKAHGKKELWQVERPVRISITDKLANIAFEDIFDAEGNLVPYKLVIPQEPVINMEPFYLFWSAEQEKLSVAYYNKSGVIGLALTFPKFVSINDAEYVDTTSYETARLYGILVKRIKGISRKAKVETPVKIFKPNFWIGRKALESINRNQYLRLNHLEIK